MAAAAKAHDLQSQTEMLRALHGWAEAAIEDVVAVYGEHLFLEVSPWPPEGDPPMFSLVVGGSGHVLTFALERNARAGSWHICAVRTLGGRDGGQLKAGPDRRGGQWTRARVEELLLSLLAGYEREQAGLHAG